jgi:hypothetical protein
MKAKINIVTVQSLGAALRPLYRQANLKRDKEKDKKEKEKSKSNKDSQKNSTSKSKKDNEIALGSFNKPGKCNKQKDIGLVNALRTVKEGAMSNDETIVKTMESREVREDLMANAISVAKKGI